MTAKAAEAGYQAVGRFGLVVKGVLQLLVGALALGAVLGVRPGRITDATGALLTLAREPYGRLLLVPLALGIFGYAAYRIVQGVFDPQRRPRTPATAFFRIGDVLGGLSYVLLGIGATRLLLGLATRSSDTRTRHLTAEALAIPYGPKMLMLFAAVVLALALLFAARAFIVRDVCGDLKTDGLSKASCRAVAVLIRFASVVQAILFATMASLFHRAALAHDAAAVRGMGGVLRLLGAHTGTWLLVLIALGFLAMAATSFIEAGWRRDLVQAGVLRLDGRAPSSS